MRTKTFLSMAFAGLLMVLVLPSALAERVKTTQTTKVMKRPGEKSAVITRIEKGRTLTVIAKDGRWMKVRVNGRTGWIARTTVTSASAREVPRNTRRRPFVDGRSTRRGWSGEAPDDRVGGDAVDDDDEDDARPRKPAKAKPKPKAKAKAKPKAKAKAKPRPRARDLDDDDDLDEIDCDDDDCEDEERAAAPKERVVMVTAPRAKLRAKPTEKGRSRGKVKKGAKLVVLEQKTGWMLVEDPDGDAGWIRTADVSEPGLRPHREIRVQARLGFERMAQVFRSNGNGNLPNYDIGAAAAAVSLRGDVLQKYKASYLIGVDLRYDLGRSSPGIRVESGGAAADVPYTTHDLGVRAIAGYDLHHRTGAAALGRVGYHYGLFQIANVGDFTKNLAHLPSETLTGFTIGAGAEAPRVTDKIGVRVAVDYLAVGSRAQTVGLEDGQVSTAQAAWANLVVNYAWKPGMTIDFGYNYEWAKTVWSGAVPASMRGTGATEAARKDTGHALSVGLARTF
jgi:uncharacterized protein YgiM (DUF1202 family)